MSLDLEQRVRDLEESVRKLELLVAQSTARPSADPGAVFQCANIELTSALARHGSATFKFLDFDTGAYVDSSESTATVYDFSGHFGPSGSRGYAVWRPIAQRWEILDLVLTRPAITFELKDVLAANTTSVSATVLATRGGLISGADVNDTVTLVNELGFTGALYGKGYAEWDDVLSRWLIYQLVCPTG